MKIRVGDTVEVIAGKDKGKQGEVLQVLAKQDKVIVEGVNTVTKHIKPSQADPEGGIVTREAPIHVSNVAFYDSKAKAPVKLGYKFVEKDGKQVKGQTVTAGNGRISYYYGDSGKKAISTWIEIQPGIYVYFDKTGIAYPPRVLN